MTDQNEVRIVNEATGGEKGQKDERWDLLPIGPLRQIARHYGVGARKYADRNWERGYDWSLSYGALMRHLAAFWSGEDIDEETQSPHLAAAAFHILALLEFSETHPELDDRPKRPGQGVEEQTEVVDAHGKVLRTDRPLQVGDRVRIADDACWANGTPGSISHYRGQEGVVQCSVGPDGDLIVMPDGPRGSVYFGLHYVGAQYVTRID